VFNYFANMTSVCGLLTWCGIAFTYLRFYKGLKVQGIDRNTLTYKAPLQPYLTYYSLVMLFLVLFFNGFSVFIKSGGNLNDEGVFHFDTSTFVTSYFPIWFAPLIYIAYNLWKKSWSMIAPEDMDFVSGSRVDEEEVEKPPKGVIGKAWAWLM
jgi:amino acid transporter